DELKFQIPVVVTVSIPPTRNRELWWIAAVWAVLVGLIIFNATRRKQSGALVPAQNVLLLPSRESRDETLQTRLMPHLARGLMNRFVRALISQRAELIQTSETGTEQLNELENQLEKITTRLQTRQSVYERRIAELEKELAAAEEENRELIRAKLHETRQNLERARAQRQ
ncbi:MAG: hypothetical protein ABI042_03350, partial [Verrucomicrobiota bacterium]